MIADSNMGGRGITCEKCSTSKNKVRSRGIGRKWVCAMFIGLRVKRVVPDCLIIIRIILESAVLKLDYGACVGNLIIFVYPFSVLTYMLKTKGKKKNLD